MSIWLVLCLNAISWNAESIEVKPRLLRFLSCQLKFIRFEGRITVADSKPESCSVIVLKTIWPCWWRLVWHCVNCDTILFYCVLIYLTLQKFKDDRTRGICCKKLPFYLNKSSKVPSWTSCWYEWHCFLQVPHWHANHFSTSLSKLFCHSIGLDYGAPEEIWSWHKLATVSTRWPCQTNEANKCSICLQQHEQTNGIPEWRIFLVSKTRGRLHANGKMQQRALLSGADENWLARWVMYSSVDNTPNISLPTSEQQ